MIDQTAATAHAAAAAAKFPEMHADSSRIVSRLIGAALGSGYTVSLHDGEAWAVKHSTDATVIAADVASTDEQTLRFRSYGRLVGDVFLVFGNDGDDVIADHSDNGEITDLVDYAQAEKIVLTRPFGFAGQTV